MVEDFIQANCQAYIESISFSISSFIFVISNEVRRKMNMPKLMTKKEVVDWFALSE